MKPDDLTIAVLKEIRDAVRETNARIDQTNARIDQTNARLDQTREELGARIDRNAAHIVESEMRTATAITSLAGAVQSVRDLLREQLDLGGRVSRCEDDIRDLKQRIDA